MKTRLTIALLLFSLMGFSQTFNINLSPNHQQKLTSIKSGHKRMVKFYKYYKKDSAQHTKKLTKQEKRLWDSTMRAERSREKLERKLARKGIVMPDSLRQQDMFVAEIREMNLVLRDSTASDSVKEIARDKLKTLATHKARQYPGYQYLEEQQMLHGDSVSWEDVAKHVPGIDTLKGIFQADPKILFQHAAKLTEQQAIALGGATSIANEFGKFEEMKNMPDEYKNQYEDYIDKDNLTKEGKDRAVEKAMDYFAEHPEKLEAAHQKASRLLSKYRAFSNSANLSDAQKHTSMEGKTFFERLVIGGNFNVVSTSPLSLDFSPQLGYKLTSRFFAGIGINYRHTFSDSIKSNWYVSPTNTALKGLVSYDILKSWYAYAESEWSRLKGISNEQNRAKQWQANYFIGVGRRFLIHPKLYMTVTALYNLNNEIQNPLHPHRFQMRIGFQLSELASRKKQINYDPNR